MVQKSRRPAPLPDLPGTMQGGLRSRAKDRRFGAKAARSTIHFEFHCRRSFLTSLTHASKHQIKATIDTMRTFQLNVLALISSCLIPAVASIQFPGRLGVGLSRNQPGCTSDANKRPDKHDVAPRGGASAVAVKTMTLAQKNLFKYVLVWLL